MTEGISLAELQQRVKEAVDGATRELVWVKGEISEIKFNPNGHCYIDLVDYKEKGNEIVAKARGVIWSRSASMLIPFFESVTGSTLKKGMRVLFKVQVQYSLLYGLTLNILDIEPAFTVGELELNRQRVIARLTQEGMFGLNGSLDLNMLPCRFAVISSETAAGYRDFVKHMTANELGVRFKIDLYQAAMQGADAVPQIVAALDRVVGSGLEYDAVVIVRGGGSALDLAIFDDYDLALNIAQYPLPVLTGIGHDHDYHIADMVAFRHLKTPTAVASYILNIYLEQISHLEYLRKSISSALQRRLKEDSYKIEKFRREIRATMRLYIATQRYRIEKLKLKIEKMDPVGTLIDGYAMVTSGEGKKLLSIEELRGLERIRLYMKSGRADLEVKVINIIDSKDKTQRYDKEN